MFVSHWMMVLKMIPHDYMKIKNGGNLLEIISRIFIAIFFLIGGWQFSAWIDSLINSFANQHEIIWILQNTFPEFDRISPFILLVWVVIFFCLPWIYLGSNNPSERSRKLLIGGTFYVLCFLYVFFSMWAGFFNLGISILLPLITTETLWLWHPEKQEII
jgi:hypothetical protein